LEWVFVCLAVGYLAAIVVTLVVAVRILQSAHRSENTAEERLEILREQQQRLEFLHEERRLLLEEIERQRSEMNGAPRPLELLAGSEEQAKRQESRRRGPELTTLDAQMPHVDGERLRQLREERALRQEDLAELAGIGKNTVNRIERNITEPHMTTVRKLAEALGVEPRELVRG
jgi:DNA-binding XRE family transcriptional regulator